MGADNWIVKNGGGMDWGIIKRLVINPGTRQINYADVFVIHTGHLARVPWETFEIGHEGISLRVAESQVAMIGIGTSDTSKTEAVSMEVWP
jgi:hypothetical protein